jgi:two-component system NtrC family sensor kinase
VTIEIADTGHGIDPRHMPRLFEPFFTTKPVGKGTGLGLSISYSLMQKMGGSVSVRSEGSGKGTTFTLRLPVAHQPDRSRNREAISAGVAANENPSA